MFRTGSTARSNKPPGHPPGRPLVAAVIRPRCESPEAVPAQRGAIGRQEGCSLTPRRWLSAGASSSGGPRRTFPRTSRRGKATFRSPVCIGWSALATAAGAGPATLTLNVRPRRRAAPGPRRRPATPSSAMWASRPDRGGKGEGWEPGKFVWSSIATGRLTPKPKGRPDADLRRPPFQGGYHGRRRWMFEERSHGLHNPADLVHVSGGGLS